MRRKKNPVAPLRDIFIDFGFSDTLSRNLAEQRKIFFLDVHA